MAGWVGEGGPYATGHLVTATEFNELRQPWYVEDFVSVTNTAVFTTLISVSIPGNMLGNSGVLRVSMGGDYLNNSGASRTLSLGATFGADTLYLDTSAAIAASASMRAWKLELMLGNQGTPATQSGFGHLVMGPITTATNGVGAMATVTQVIDSPFAVACIEDTTAAKTLGITVQHAVANANLTLRMYHALLEIFPYS